MKRWVAIVTLGTFALFGVQGCATMENLSKKVTGSGPDTSGLMNQVPPENLKEVQKAEFNLGLAGEEVKLAQLKSKWASVAEDYAKYDKDLADQKAKEAEYGVELAKAEAIDKSELGKKEDNIKAIADKRVKRLNAEADRVQIEAKMATTKREMDFLQQQIADQEKRIREMKAAGPQALKSSSPPAAEPKPKDEGAKPQGQEKPPETSKPASGQ
jgi:hypothetical protein